MFCTGVEGSYAIRAARVHEVCSLLLISTFKNDCVNFVFTTKLCDGAVLQCP